jgi:hypothetical protein
VPETLNVETFQRALSARRIHQPPRGNFRLLLPRASDCISRGRALDPACFAAGRALDSNPSLDPPQPTAVAVEATDDGVAAAAAEAARRPFTALSQEEADLALARVLQEQVSDDEISQPRGHS